MSETAGLPQHVGIIMDGNRRWAKANDLPALDGHQRGGEVFKEIALATFDRGVTYLSAFVFSTENWTRTEEEVGYLMKLVVKATEKYLDAFNKAGIKIVLLGRRDGLKKDVLASLERTESKTKNNQKGTLALCFNYGGQEEVVDAVKRIIDSKVASVTMTVDVLRKHLYAPDVPDLDLIIRTSGEQRLSGFMLMRSAYAELYFIDKHWPDFTVKDLDAAFEAYKTRERRFGQ